MNVFTEDGIELVEVSLSVVISVPLDEETRRLVLLLCAAKEVVKDIDVSVALESCSVVPSEDEKATDLDSVVVAGTDVPVTIFVEEAMVIAIVEIGPGLV